jgi:hypothetical protein
MRVKIDGVPALSKALRAYAKDLGHAFRQSSADAADTLLRNTDVFVKQETGALQASGIWMQEKEGLQTETIIGYGAEPEFPHYRVFVSSGRIVLQKPEKYAAKQHDEIQEAIHPGTQWKWMDHGVDMFQSVMVGMIAEEMSRI